VSLDISLDGCHESVFAQGLDKEKEEEAAFVRGERRGGRGGGRVGTIRVK
jgi:hypothetical protein